MRGIHKKGRIAMDNSSVQAQAEVFERIRAEVGRVVVGQEKILDRLLAALVCQGHVLLEGVPGIAKTTLVRTLARAIGLSFGRVSFTPDLLPADVTGTLVYSPKDGSFTPKKGPVFTNLLLADEINRAPAKVQSALLEAMQERQVTIGEATYPLPSPFLVLATQNPIEQEGTYPLPEAQLDRFMFNIVVDYPSREEEMRIIRQVTAHRDVKLEKVLDAEQVIALQNAVGRVPVADHVIEFANDLARSTRPKSDEAPDFVKEMVAWGAGPRAGIYLVTAAKARAVLHGRYHATTADVAAVAAPVLRHRVLTTFNAEASGVTSDHVIRMLLDKLRPSDNIEI